MKAFSCNTWLLVVVAASCWVRLLGLSVCWAVCCFVRPVGSICVCVARVFLSVLRPPVPCRSCFVVLFSDRKPLFSFHTLSYLNPGSLRKSPGDLCLPGLRPKIAGTILDTFVRQCA